MKTAAIIALLLAHACGQPPAKTATVSTPTEAAAQVTTQVVLLEFEKDIQPILQSHCMPCHFKGGKMYERMPFDQSKTLVDFQTGILRRIKDDSETERIKLYLSQLKSG